MKHDQPRETVRTFVALFLPEQTLEAIAGVIAERSASLPSVRWVAHDNVHLTLRFLGDVERARLPGVADALRDACATVSPLTLALAAAGAFPSPRAPRVIWAGLAGDVEPLRQLASALERNLRAAGYGRADKPFAPHLTIGRVRPPVPRLDWAARLAAIAFPAAPFTIASAAVVQSELSPKGSRYTPLATVPLGGARSLRSERIVCTKRTVGDDR
jgi:2'-5' RNA ligase